MATLIIATAFVAGLTVVGKINTKKPESQTVVDYRNKEGKEVLNATLKSL